MTQRGKCGTVCKFFRKAIRTTSVLRKTNRRISHSHQVIDLDVDFRVRKARVGAQTLNKMLP